MKVKFWKSTNILTLYNRHFEVNINTSVLKIDGETIVLYDPSDIVRFIDEYFIPRSTPATIQESEKFMKLFLFQGCSRAVENKLYVTAVGLKHFFSSLVSFRATENQHANELEREHSKFISWFINFDFNAIIYKAHNMIDISGACTFCKNMGCDKDMDRVSFCHDNSEVIANWRYESSKAGETLKYDDDKIDFLVCLAKVAGRELQQIIAHDNKVSQKKSQKAPLARYDPCEDWESSSPVVKIFINEILSENQSDLFKITFRNTIFLGNLPKNYPFKPQSCA